MKDPVVGMIMIGLSFPFGAYVGREIESELQKRSAIKAGVAQFNAKTAAFEWIVPVNAERDYVTEVNNQMISNRLNNQKCE